MDCPYIITGSFLEIIESTVSYEIPLRSKSLLVSLMAEPIQQHGVRMAFAFHIAGLFSLEPFDNQI